MKRDKIKRELKGALGELKRYQESARELKAKESVRVLMRTEERK